jgi:DNA polymerase-3 subunit delta
MAGKKAATLSPDKVLTQLSLDDPAPVYFIYAGETARRGMGKGDQSPYNDYLLDKLLLAFRKAIVDNNPRDFNFSQFIADEAGMSAVVSVAQTYPMMRKRRLVIVKDAHQFKSADWAQAEAYLNNPSPSTVLVLVGEHLPTQNKGGANAAKLVKAACALVPVEPFGRVQDIVPYLQTELKQRKLTLDRNAEALLLDLLGTDMNELLGAIDKLALYAGEREKISLEDVQAVVAKTRGEDLWGFQDALAARKLAPALGLLGRLMENAKQEDEIMLIGALVRHFRGVAEIRRMLDKRMPRNQIMGNLSGSPYANEKRFNQATGHSAASLATLLSELEKLDRAIRFSRVPHPALFERFVLRSCGPTPGR